MLISPHSTKSVGMLCWRLFDHSSIVKKCRPYPDVKRQRCSLANSDSDSDYDLYAHKTQKKTRHTQHTQHTQAVNPCITCKHSQIGLVQIGDTEPRIDCTLFTDTFNPVTGEKKFKSAFEMRKIGMNDPDACSFDGRLYQKRTNELELLQFNALWFAAWTICLVNIEKNKNKNTI